MTRDAGFGSVDETMELSTIDQYFGKTVPKLSALPPAYTKNCHYMRDDQDDEAVQDPITFHPDHIDSSADASRTSDFRRERETADGDESESEYFRNGDRVPWSPAHSQSLNGFDSDESGEGPNKRQRTDMADKQSSPTHPSNGGSMPLDDISNAQNQMRGDGLASAGGQAVMAARSAAAAAQAAMEQEIERDLEIEREIQQEDGF